MSSKDGAAREASLASEKPPVTVSRRDALKLLGLGGVLLAGSSMGISMASAASHESSGEALAEVAHHVPTVAALLQLPVDELVHGAVVAVAGYHEPGDGGGKLVYWDANATEEENGGTVHTPAGHIGAGRWKQVTNGVGDFRTFGILGPDQPADAALDAMMSDPRIRRIEAHTDLRFVRRHTFRRGDIELDFLGNTVYTDDIESSLTSDPFAAVFYFKGKITTDRQQTRVPDNLPELTDVLPVSNSAAFSVGQWWTVRVNNLAGQEERELDKLVQVTEIIDNKHIRVNYKLGWPVPARRALTYQRIEPVFRAHVRNMVFVGAGSSALTGAHPVAYEYAVECNVSDVHAVGTYWPVIMRRYCTHYITERCRLENPTEVQAGGTGYLTQQIYCLYGQVRDCTCSNARHLCDFTGSAYCHVENCHGDGDDLGAFVTHGQYEHDLTYVGNSGMISFANSGHTWGSSATRIVVKQHVGTRFIAHAKVSDLTLEDVHVVRKEGLANSGSIWINADGAQLTGCTAETMITFSQASERSKRKTIARSCSFTLSKDHYVVREDVTSDISLVDCTLAGVDGNLVRGANHLCLVRCDISAAEDAAPMVVDSTRVSIVGCRIVNAAIFLTAGGDQELTVGAGTELSGSNTSGTFFRNSKSSGSLAWNLQGYRSNATSPDMAHFHLRGVNERLHVVGCSFHGGRFACNESDPSSGGLQNVLYLGCIEEQVDRSGLPQHVVKAFESSPNLIGP